MSDAGDDAKNNFAVAPGNQPKASNVSKDSSYLQGDQSGAVPANRIPASVGESKMDSVPVSKPDGLKILVSANMGSTTLGKLPMDQTPDLKVQSLGSGTSCLYRELGFTMLTSFHMIE